MGSGAAATGNGRCSERPPPPPSEKRRPRAQMVFVVFSSQPRRAALSFRPDQNTPGNNGNVAQGRRHQPLPTPPLAAFVGRVIRAAVGARATNIPHAVASAAINHVVTYAPPLSSRHRYYTRYPFARPLRKNKRAFQNATVVASFFFRYYY